MKKNIIAVCDSEPCKIKNNLNINSATPMIKETAKPSDFYCPDCGHALLWTEPSEFFVKRPRMNKKKHKIPKTYWME